MNNWYDNFSSFKFDNNTGDSFTCKRPKSFECKELENLSIALLWENSLDFVVSGEDGCMGNYDMYTPLYNYYTGKQYLISYSVAEDWKNGKEVTIYGTTPNESEMKDIEEFTENEGR